MTVKLDEIIVALEGEVEEQKRVIEQARRQIELANGRIKWATRVVRWLRSGTDPETLQSAYLVAPPSKMEMDPHLHPCAYDAFVGATIKGLRHHETVKHPDKPFKCANHLEE